MRVAGNRRSGPRAARAGIQAGFPPRLPVRRGDVLSGNDEPRHPGYGFPDHSGPAGFATRSEHAAQRRRARLSLYNS
jgi:hypothetical protein